MSGNTDEVLIQHIKQHDQRALESLFEKYFYSLSNFAYSFVKSTELAEEVVSDVFFNIWSKREKLEIKDNLKGYLFLATRNQSLNYRSKENFNTEEVDVTKEYINIPEFEAADSDIQYKELEIEIQHILEELPPQRRLIFKLNRLDGLKYKEIAETLSISVNTVQKQMIEASRYVEQYKPRLKALLCATSVLFIF
jgi:RNA polymerase sigma-70 factor (ECF subfamily)